MTSEEATTRPLAGCKVRDRAAPCPPLDRTTAGEKVERIEAALHVLLTGTLACGRRLGPSSRFG
jgi:hypothetical protein